MLERADVSILGASDDALLRTDSEMAAVHAALERARAGDLILLTIHSDRSEVLNFVSGLEERGWTPGDALE